MDILAAYREVGSYRGAAAMCGTTHKTVRRVVERHSGGGAVPPRRDRGHNYETVRELVAGRVRKSQGRISAKRLLPAARAAGYAGSARNFRRLVAEVKAAWRAGHHRGRRPAVWSPGDTLVIDWGSVGGLHVFCAVLADRMGCLKAGVVANVVVPAAEYVRFATHYGFRPDFCEAADPESKGIVEHLVGYAKRDLIVPAEPSVTDLGAANAAAAGWCAEVNAVLHSEICAVPAERLEQERALLGPLPSLRCEIGARPASRKVDKLSCVRFGSARYSVPSRLIGATVLIRVAGERVQVLEPCTGEVAAEHQLVAPGEVSVCDEHYGSSRPGKPRRAPRARTTAEKQFLALGEPAAAFLAGAAAAGVSSLAREITQILTLQAAHGDTALIAALARAVEFRRWRADDIRSILAAAGAAPAPRLAGKALVLTLPAVPVRPLSDYAFSAGPAGDDQ